MMTTRLMQNNHRLVDIQEYTLYQFVHFLDETQRAEARTRIAFSVDMSVAAAAVMGGNEVLTKHIDSLQLTANGE